MDLWITGKDYFERDKFDWDFDWDSDRDFDRD